MKRVLHFCNILYYVVCVSEDSLQRIRMRIEIKKIIFYQVKAGNGEEVSESILVLSRLFPECL